jgi:hypothetical protein
LCGALAYIDKPFDFAYLKRVVALALRPETGRTGRAPALNFPVSHVACVVISGRGERKRAPGDVPSIL